MLRSLSRSSGTPSPPSSPQRKKHRLSMAGVADLFVKIRRWEDRAISTDDLELTSGDPKTHPNVAEGAKEYDKILVEQTDYFICVGGVNLPTLLRITRIALMEHVKRELGANSVIDEQWECVTKPVHSGKYRVQIRYTASATMSSVPDCRQPVALDQAKSIPGLMSILKRNDA